jgi:hypothetical protein
MTADGKATVELMKVLGDQATGVGRLQDGLPDPLEVIREAGEPRAGFR